MYKCLSKQPVRPITKFLVSEPTYATGVVNRKEQYVGLKSHKRRHLSKGPRNAVRKTLQCWILGSLLNQAYLTRVGNPPTIPPLDGSLLLNITNIYYGGPPTLQVYLFD